MATISVNTNLTDVTYTAGEQFTINTGAQLLVDSQPPRNLGFITCITSGELRIVNNSATVPLVFSLDVIANDFRLEKNGKMITRGAPITLGTGDGTANQSFSLNSAPLDIIPYPSVVMITHAGKTLPWAVIPVAGTTITIPVTEFEGGGFDSANVVFWNATTRTLAFGDNTNGNVLPTGAVVQIANIYVTSGVGSNSPILRSQFDLNAAGILDCEWTAFSDRIYISISGFGGVRMVNSGVTGTFIASNSNGFVELDGFQLNPDPNQTTVADFFQTQIIFGQYRMARVRSWRGGLITGVGKNIISKLYNTPDRVFPDCSFYIRQGFVTTSGEALALLTLPTLDEFRNLCVGGHRLEATNVANVLFSNLKMCDNTDGSQRTVAILAIALINCQDLVVTNFGNCGASAFRNALVSTNDECANINFYRLDYDGGNNTAGLGQGTGDNLNFYNSILRNMRASTTLSDAPSTYLSSRAGMYNVRATSLGSILNDAIAGAEYNPLAGTRTVFNTPFNSANDFAFANLVDLGVNPTGGNILVGSFGLYTGANANKMSFVGQAQLDQAGGVELFNIDDVFEVESLFALRGITAIDLVATTIYTSTLGTDTATQTAGITFEFAIANPTGAFTAYEVYTATAMNTALAALSGYNSDNGLRVKMRFTATTNNATRVLTQMLIPTTFDSGFLYPDGFVSISGANVGDTVRAYVFDPLENDPSLNTEIGALVGSGQLQISASSFLAQQFYIIRFDSDGVRIMSTRSTPREIVLGDNGAVALYSGDEVQLAQSPQLLDLDGYIRNFLDAKISEIAGGGGGGGATAAEVWTYSARELTAGGVTAIQAGLAPANEYDAELAAIQADLDNPAQYRADVSGLATEANATTNRTTVIAATTVVNGNVKKASLLVPATADIV